MPKGADIIFCDAYRYFAGQALFITSESRSHRECLIPTDNIVMFD